MPIHIQKITQANFEALTFSPSGKARETVKFELHLDGRTSYVAWHKQIFNANSIQDQKTAALKLKEQDITQQDTQYYTDRVALFQDKKDEIEEHVERRVQLFFQQAILCYNTPFVYTAGGAEDQIGGGCTIKLNGNKPHKTQAAHSSTFPCLYAYPKDGDGNTNPNKRFVFLKHSHAYNQHNSTVELPIEVNQTDTLLDGKVNENKLRDRSLKLINRLAQKKLSPTKATKRFLTLFKEELEKQLAALPSDDLRREILTIYLERVAEFIDQTEDSKEIFDQILGLSLPETDDILRKVVYKKRFKLIQTAEFIESQIAKRILKAQNTMVRRRAKSLKSVDYRLRLILLKEASGTERKFLEKLFCTSPEQLELEQNQRAKLRRVQTASNNLGKKHREEIDNLKRDLRQYRRELQKIEYQFRAELFKGLRTEYKDWYQKEFVAAYRRAYPSDSMSQPMVSRLEQPSRMPKAFYASPEAQRRKEMTIAKAKKISKVFQVDLGLFLPCLISSEDL